MYKIDYPFNKEIMACGAQHLANFCLTKKDCGFIMNDLGNLNESSAWDRYQNEISRLRKELKVKPKVITSDLNPGFNSTKYGQAAAAGAKGVKYLAVQHQKAHLASCIGENNLEGKTIGVVLDGAGYGEDAKFWGAEVFLGNLQEMERVAHLEYTAVPKAFTGAISSTQQLAASFLYQSYGDSFTELPLDFVQRKTKDDWQDLILRLQDPLHTTSMASIFDVVAVMLGLRENIEQEGQGVSELERIINRSSHVSGHCYDFTLQRNKESWIINFDKIFQNIVEDLKKSISRSIISTVLHNTICEMIKQTCLKVNHKQKVKNVVLTGSVFQNKSLFNKAKSLLTAEGFNIVEHKHFACNDSNISFGQAVYANAQKKAAAKP
ncbi:hypothetical protein ACFL1I_07545 [Candidatus Omnitrophota bacterium]